MNIYAKAGSKVVYKGHDEDVNRYWCPTNPIGILEEGQQYIIDGTDVGSECTAVHLRGIDSDGGFNSVLFDDVAEEPVEVAESTGDVLSCLGAALVNQFSKNYVDCAVKMNFEKNTIDMKVTVPVFIKDIMIDINIKDGKHAFE